MDSFIIEMQSSKARKTIDSYKACRRNLREFEQWRGLRITFDNIDLDFYYKLVNYLIEEKNYAKNTIGYCIKELKLFLNEATERGLNTNMAFKSRKFKVLREDAENIYLTEQEIDDIYNLDLSNQPPRLDKVRDMFVLACNVGLRISDLKRVNSSNIKEKTINIRTQKTGELVVIPINSRVREILDKYDGAMPPAYSEQKFNDYIKELGELAGIDDPTNKSMTKAGSVATETKPKYMLITSHTARRSFATNAYKNGVPTIAIMKITGHRSVKTFLNYIKIGKEENAEQIANHPFFK